MQGEVSRSGVATQRENPAFSPPKLTGYPAKKLLGYSEPEIKFLAPVKRLVDAADLLSELSKSSTTPKSTQVASKALAEELESIDQIKDSQLKEEKLQKLESPLEQFRVVVDSAYRVIDEYNETAALSDRVSYDTFYNQVIVEGKVPVIENGTLTWERLTTLPGLSSQVSSSTPSRIPEQENPFRNLSFSTGTVLLADAGTVLGTSSDFNAYTVSTLRADAYTAMNQEYMSAPTNSWILKFQDPDTPFPQNMLYGIGGTLWALSEVGAPLKHNIQLGLANAQMTADARYASGDLDPYSYTVTRTALAFDKVFTLPTIFATSAIETSKDAVIGLVNMPSSLWNSGKAFTNEPTLPNFYNLTGTAFDTYMFGEGLKPTVSSGYNKLGSAITETLAKNIDDSMPSYSGLAPQSMIEASRYLNVENGADAFMISFMGKNGIKYYDNSDATLGAKGGAVWVAPLDDVAEISNRAGIVTGTGHAPGPLKSYLQGESIYGIAVPSRSLSLRLPSAADAGAYVHFRLGGTTGVEHNGIWRSSNVREFILDGGNSVPEGSVFFEFGSDGAWIPIRRF